MSINWDSIQQQHQSRSSKKESKQQPTSPQLPQDGQVIEFRGLVKDMDKFGKLQIEAEECKDLQILKQQYPHIKLPYKTMYGFGGEKNFISVSLGYSKNDQALIRNLSNRKNRPTQFKVVLQTYSSSKFGTGAYLVLNHYTPLDVPML